LFFICFEKTVDFGGHLDMVEKKISKKFSTKKSCKIKLTFISKNLFDIWSLQSKVMDKIQRGCWKMLKKMSLPTYLWTLSITFDWRLQMSNEFFEMKANLILQLFLVQSFLKKVILLCQNEVWISTFNIIPAFSFNELSTEIVKDKKNVVLVQ